MTFPLITGTDLLSRMFDKITFHGHYLRKLPPDFLLQYASEPFDWLQSSSERFGGFQGGKRHILNVFVLSGFTPDIL